MHDLLLETVGMSYHEFTSVTHENATIVSLYGDTKSL